MTGPRVERIAYSDGWKYRLEANYELATGILPPHGTPVQLDYVALTEDGVLRVARGYCWDGPSGPTHDGPESLRAALVHDAGYQLMGAGLLPVSMRDQWDALFLRILEQDGMGWVRRSVWYRAVRWFGPRAGSREKPVRYAPSQD